jgi:peptide/nickel transport system substrate-binding protein
MKFFALLALSSLVAGLPSATSAGEPARINSYTQPHVLRYAEAEDIAGLNPVLVQQGAVNRLSQLTMAYLFRWNHDNKPEPELATVLPSLSNGGVRDGGRTLTFHIRKNVKWSDGAPFDADDVVFSFNVMNNPANNITSRTGFDLIEKIDEPDKYTVVLHMRRPFSPMIPVFDTSGGGPSLLPKHLLGSLANINEAPYNALPIGIGPFRYTAWRHGDEVEMEANPNYWRGLPKLKKIVFKIVPDRNTVLTQLQTGELDYWYPFGGAYLVRIQALTNVTYLRQPGYLYNHIDFNVSRPALRDAAVRRALRYAVDRATLRDKVGHGVGILQESMVPAPYPGVVKLPLVPYDLAKANALLDAAGWKRGSDGIRAKDGTRLALEFASSTGSPDVDTQLEIIRSSWQQIGVDMTVKRYPGSLMFAPAEGGGIVLGGRFDAIAFAWGVSPVDDLFGNFSCDAIPPKGQNDLHNCNTALEPLFIEFESEFDPGRQAAALSKAVRIIVNDAPTIVTTSREDMAAFNKDLKNFHPKNVTLFDDMMNVDI